MSELLREIEEDIRAERLEALWKRFGAGMVRVSIAIVVGTVIAVVWQNHQKSAAAERTAALLTGIDRMAVEDYKGAIAAFDALGKDSAQHGLALLYKAQAQAALGDKDGARKTYEALAAEKADKKTVAFVELGKLAAGQAPAVSADAPFYASAQERAAWRLVADGKKAEAEAAFTALRDDDKAPRSLRARAAAAVDYLK